MFVQKLFYESLFVKRILFIRLNFTQSVRGIFPLHLVEKNNAYFVYLKTLYTTTQIFMK